MTIFREEATSSFAGFHAGPLSWLNWNLEMLVSVERRKPENPEKNPWSKTRTNKTLQSTYDVGSRIRTQDTLVGGECSTHCTISAPATCSCLSVIKLL